MPPQTAPRTRTYTDRVTDQGVESLDPGRRRDSEEPRTEGERNATAAGVKRALIVLAVLLLVLVGGAAGFVGYLGYTVNENVTHEALLPENRPPVTAPDGTGHRDRHRHQLPRHRRRHPPGRRRPLRRHRPRAHPPGRQDGQHDPLPPRPLRRHPGPRQGQDQRRLRLRPRAAPRRDDREPAQGPHPPRRQDQLRGLQEHDGCRGRRPRVRRGGEQRLRQRRPGRHQEGLERPQRRAGPGLRPRALHAQRGRHLPWPPPARLHQGADAQGDQHRDGHQPDQDRQVHQRRDREPRRSTRTSRSASCATTRSRCATSGPTTSSSRRHRSPASAPRPGGASIDIVDKKGMADLGEALRTDTMDDYGDVFVTP